MDPRYENPREMSEAFIYCEDVNLHYEWTKNFKVIKGVHKNMIKIIEKIII
jgi:hypothetical protein